MPCIWREQIHWSMLSLSATSSHRITSPLLPLFPPGHLLEPARLRRISWLGCNPCSSLVWRLKTPKRQSCSYGDKKEQVAVYKYIHIHNYIYIYIHWDHWHWIVQSFIQKNQLWYLGFLVLCLKRMIKMVKSPSKKCVWPLLKTNRETTCEDRPDWKKIGKGLGKSLNHDVYHNPRLEMWCIYIW